MYKPNALDHALNEAMLSVCMAISEGDIETADFLFKQVDTLRAEWEERNNNVGILLTSFGDKKIAVIKVVRTYIAGLGLKQAKDLVESVPVVLANMKAEKASNFCQDLIQAGGIAKLKKKGD